jgi:hypothetical protein
LCDLKGRLLGDREKAVLLLRNGLRLLRASRHAETLAVLGKAHGCALEKDSVLLLAEIALAASKTYEAMGLFWASRMEAAMAAHLAITDSKRVGYASREALRAVMRLVWIELRLGRIPLVLAWHELASRFIKVLKSRGESTDSWEDELHNQDTVLSLFFITADEKVLRRLTKIPNTLERLGLFASRCALLFALGQEQVLKNDGLGEQDIESLPEMFAHAFHQPAMSDIPATAPILHVESQDAIQTNLLGMFLRLEHDNTLSSIALAEDLASAVEAWFATATWKDVLFLRSVLNIRVTEDSSAPAELPDVESLMADARTIRIRPSWASDFHQAGVDDSRFADWVLNFLAGVMAQASPRSGVTIDSFLQKLADSESFNRTLTYLPISKLTVDDVGKSRYFLVHWTAGVNYPLARNEAWWRIKHEKERDAATQAFLPRPAGGQRVTVNDLIDVELWGRAGWRAAFQIVPADLDAGPPVLALVFRNPTLGDRIFEGVRSKITENSATLRVAVILGDGGRMCKEYALSIGPDVGTAPSQNDPTSTDCGYEIQAGAMQVLPLTRTSDVLGMFLDAVNSRGHFLLVPGALYPNGQCSVSWSHGIECRNVVVRLASEITSPNDLDAIAARSLVSDKSVREKSRDSSPKQRTQPRRRKTRKERKEEKARNARNRR